MPRRLVASRQAAAVLAWTALAGCVATPLDHDPAADPALGQGAVVIPLGGSELVGDEKLLTQFYDNVLRGMRQAYQDGDASSLQAQLQAYDKPAAPAWAREQLDTYRRLQVVLAFEQSCQRRARVSIEGQKPPIGAPLRFMLTIPGVPELEVGLGAEHDPEPFSVGVLFRIEDRDAAGGVRVRDSNQVVKLPERFLLTSDESLRLPMELQSGAGGAVVRSVGVWVELLPGYVSINGERSPMRRAPLIEQRIELYPKGFEAVRDRPLQTLQEAMRRGDADHFPHLFLAAWLMPRDKVEPAMGRLIPWVRIGRDDQARVAMVALRRLAGEDIAIDDRESWLQWWRDR